MSTPLKVAVIGCGYLGQFHAEKFAQLPETELVAVVDTDAQQAEKVAKKCKTQALTDYQAILDQVDAVSIVTPTHTHYAIGKVCLDAGLHVLMEKPICNTVAEAETLIECARAHNCVLQVGFLERFNPIVTATVAEIQQPMFIESARIMPFNPRNKDINVVLDLMIHDIDLIQSIVQSPITSIDASGACVLTERTDIANARIHFANQCVANVTASRISLKPERKMRIFQGDAYFSLDFQEKQVSVCTRGQGEMFPGIPNIKRQVTKAKKPDALRDEIQDFAAAILHKRPPLVTGEAGKSALETALKITDMVTSGPHYRAAKA